MRKALRVSTLMLALCCPALAGEIHNPPVTPPPPPPPQQQTTPGDIQIPPLVKIALTLLALL